MTTMKVTQAPSQTTKTARRPAPDPLIVSGGLAFLLSLLGLTMLPTLTIAAVLTAGLALVGAALYQVARIWGEQPFRERARRLGYALAYAFGGLAMISNPPGAATGLTLFGAIALGILGFQRLLLQTRRGDAAAARRARSAGWLSLGAGTAVLVTWPLSSTWAIGVAVAAYLGAIGWGNLTTGIALRRIPRVVDSGKSLEAGATFHA